MSESEDLWLVGEEGLGWEKDLAAWGKCCDSNIGEHDHGDPGSD